MLYRGLPSAVRRFEADYPNVEVVLKEMNTHEQAQAILRAQIDVGYAHWGTFPPEIAADTILSEPFLCCLPATHRLARRRRVDLAALAHEPFILFPRDAAPHYHDLIIAQCVSAGFSPQIRHEARLWQTVLTMVEFEMGVALVPSVLREVRSERLRYLPLAGDALESRTLRLRRSNEREPVAECFGEYLDDEIRRLRGAAE
ncbi:hypothetical protein BMMON2_34280 [Burkholderia mallei]